MLDPLHLFELAESLATTSQVGAPRQAVLRRAVSTAYYAVFHELCGEVAQTFVSAGARDLRESRALFYRAVDHSKSKTRCAELGQSPLPKKLGSFFAMSEFDQDLRDFANAFVQLQDRRHLSDYDPDYKLTKVLARQYVDDAGEAISKLRRADDTQRNKFLAYILFGIRA